MKTTLQIDAKAAQELISRFEPTAANVSDLCKQVANSYNKEKGTNISFSTFSLRIKQGVLKTNVKAGKRGRAAGVALSDEQKVAMQLGRGKARKSRKVDVVALNASHVGYEKLVERAAQGSKVAAIKLKCLNCVCFQPKEISLCTSVDCALHQFRPYQR